MSISLFRPRHVSLLGEMMRDLARIESSFLPPNYSNDFPSEVTNDKSKFAVNLNVSQFKPENLKINLDGRKLTIEGNEEIENDHGYSKRSFSRLIYLPEDVDLSAVSSNLTNDGKLSIEAPKLENYSTNGRNIPIQQKNTENSNEKN